MKHLKTFENTLKASSTSENLNRKDSIKVNIVAKEFIERKNIPAKIEKLKLQDFLDNCFDYRDIFETFIWSGKVAGALGLYDPESIYYVIDNFCEKENILISQYIIDNIVNKLYKEYKIASQLDNKLIKIFEKNPTKYKKCFRGYKLYISNVVKNACEWMIAGEKYNL